MSIQFKVCYSQNITSLQNEAYNYIDDLYRRTQESILSQNPILLTQIAGPSQADLFFLESHLEEAVRHSQQHQISEKTAKMRDFLKKYSN
jgi:hypothetical protein